MTYLPLRVRAKIFLRNLLPARLFTFISHLWRATLARFIHGQETLSEYQKRFLAKYPKVVQAGPFKGMQYVDKAVGSSYLHKLIGSYEAVLHPFIEKFSKEDFDTVIDIGSAEGYYLIGLGMKLPKAHLIGFELEQTGRELSREMYQKNNLHNKLTLLGEARAENVAPLITENTLLICDCEGAEIDILDTEKEPDLKKVRAGIIELHDAMRPGVKEALTERFKNTHNITLVVFALANPNNFPFFKEVTNEKDLYEIRRERGLQEQEWMILTKKV